MAKIPQSVLDRQPVLPGLVLRGRGKVRDSYNLEDPSKMLVVASDRCSIFDFVLNTLIGFKGEVLCALNYFWTKNLLSSVFETDLIAAGFAIDAFLPEALRGNVDLQKRATVVKLLPAPDVEDIVRIILTGSGWQSYQKDETVCGHKLPPNLRDGSFLPYPLYTPTTKAEVGHDVHITADSVANSHGFLRERLAIQAACMVSGFAAERGIILADTKFEFSQLSDGSIVLADEKATPDSSRFVDKTAWLKASKKGVFPPSLDKQFVREWGKANGINGSLDPEDPEIVSRVHSLVVPEDVVKVTTNIYRYIFWRLTGMKIERFQRKEMGIAVEDQKLKVEVLVGSESDLPQIQKGLSLFKCGRVASSRVSVISCHRNPKELRDFVRDELTKADVVIAGAGMAAALPGIVKSLLCELNHPQIPVIGVAFKGATPADDKAAIDSIERLPGQPVELDSEGHAHFGDEGFVEACYSAIMDEFLQKTVEKKPVKIGIFST